MEILYINVVSIKYGSIPTYRDAFGISSMCLA